MTEIKKYILFSFVFICYLNVYSIDYQCRISHDNPVCCTRIDSNMFTYVLPNDSFRLKSVKDGSGLQFMGTYENVSTEAIVALEYAFDQWSNYLNSPIPIRVFVKSESLGTNVLASASPDSYPRDFEGALPNFYYPVALAEKITRKNLNGDEYDIIIRFSNDANLWYFGTTGSVPSGKYDFVSVIMHELGHGLGFIGSMDVNSKGLGLWGFQGTGLIFDQFIENGNKEQLINTSIFDNPSEELKWQYTGNNLHFNSAISAIKNPTLGRPRLYAPATFNGGSSIYHLNDATYPAGDINSLMTHATGAAEVIHVPGPLAVNMLEEMGWVNTYFVHKQAKDVEDVNIPVKFITEIISDNPPAIAQNYVFYKPESGIEFDSIPMNPTGNPNEFFGELFVTDTGQYVNYFLKAYDNYGRVYTEPVNAPVNLHTFHAGFDKNPPIIVHDPIPFIVLGTDSLEVTAMVTDNLGVDTVIVYYNINFSSDTFSLGLSKQSDDLYKGYFQFNDKNLQLNDIIEYRLLARDVSNNKNKLLLENELLIFEVEETADVKLDYVQDFNSYTSDFFGVKKLVDPQTDLNFEISEPQGFNDGCLHTPQPYKSSGNDAGYFEYVAQLRFPIKLKKNSYMRFDEIVLVEPGLNNTQFGSEDFFDYVIVEASKDSGKTWIALQPGYDSRKNTDWKNTYNSLLDDDQNSTALGKPELYVSNYINIATHNEFSAGDVVNFRFRMYSDPFVNGWGWAIDNLDIQSVVGIEALPFDNAHIDVYPNPVGSLLYVDIQLETPVQYFRVSLQDIYGRSHYTYDGRPALQTFNNEIDMSQLPKGIYFLVMDAGKESKIRKVVKN